MLTFSFEVSVHETRVMWKSAEPLKVWWVWRKIKPLNVSSKLCWSCFGGLCEVRRSLVDFRLPHSFFSFFSSRSEVRVQPLINTNVLLQRKKAFHLSDRFFEYALHFISNVFLHESLSPWLLLLYDCQASHRQTCSLWCVGVSVEQRGHQSWQPRVWRRVSHTLDILTPVTPVTPVTQERRLGFYRPTDCTLALDLCVFHSDQI